MVHQVEDGVVAQLEQQHRGMWGRASSTYTDGAESLTRGAVEPLLDGARVGNETRLLDVGTGPGTVIGPALQRGAVVTAIDLTESMVEVARARFPTADVRVGNASALPFDDGCFDAVTLAFSLHHMAQPGLALAEARRVLRSGGRIAFTVWAAADRLVAFNLAFAALEGLDLEYEAPLPTPLDEAGPEDCVDLLRRAGFTEPSVRELDTAWLLDDASPLADLIDRYLGLEGNDRAKRQAYADAVSAAVAAHVHATGSPAVPNPALLASAQRG